MQTTRSQQNLSLETSALLELIETQRDATKAIATGTSIDNARRSEYRRRASKIAESLSERGIRDPFSWPDLDNLWSWSRRWSTYEERRQQIDKKVQPVLDRLTSAAVDDWGSPTDHWELIEKRLTDLREEMGSATTLDDYQDVGRRCREIVIDTVNEVFTSEMVPEGEEPPKGANAKARFEHVIASYSAGNSQKELRALMVSAWNLFQKTTHSSSTQRPDAFAAAQVTILLVRTLEDLTAATHVSSSE